MKEYINKIQKDKTSNSNPGTNTDLANSLELLSSGIYTEEERFIFELLQNAVDAHDNSLNNDLRIRIDVQDDFLVFMHNGNPFSCRDIEGICSVGNGEKAKDFKKIGYKGIGFKSVFMHSNRVYIKSDDVVFRFEKAYWNDFYGIKVSDTGRKYKMPWQIIPIYSESLPVAIDMDGLNVCTLIESNALQSLNSKIVDLLDDCQFLLFLRNNNVSIELFSNGVIQTSVKKTSSKPTYLAENIFQSEIALYSDEKLISKWLIYKNEDVLVPESIKSIIRKDPKTPQKLQDAESYDLSFAISINNEGELVKLDQSVLYTYLPTSCKFGLPFLVNANFMTDAGRQQLITDSEWNKMIISSIPEQFLSWMSLLSSHHAEYVDILPSIKNSYKTLGEVFENSLKVAISKVPFIPELNNIERKLKVCESIIDSIELHKGITHERFDMFVLNNYKQIKAYSRLISTRGIEILKEYGVQTISAEGLRSLLENTEIYLKGIDELECRNFCQWIHDAYWAKNEDFINFIKGSRFLLDERSNLTAPEDLFFPSDYRDDNEIANDAKIISTSLLDYLQELGLKKWLIEVGMQEMSQLTIVSNLLCKDNYITTENALEVLQFIFDVNCEEDVFDNISSTTLKNIKALTINGVLKPISQLYIDQFYKSLLVVDFEGGVDAFVSHDYLRKNDDPFEWLIFLKKLGASDSIKVTNVIFERNSPEFNRLSDYADYARNHEYNHSSWTGGNYYMTPYSLRVRFVPLLDLNNIHYGVSKLVWNSILCQSISFDRSDDYIHGSTGYGYTKNAYLLDNCEGHRYLGRNYIPWVIENYDIMPATNGKLYRVQQLFENTEYNQQLFGPYMPVFDIQSSIDYSWKEYLNFRKDCSLEECLDLLSYIYQEDDEDIQKDNLDRVSLIYRHICDNFDLSIGTTNYQKVVEWGMTGRILSLNKKFLPPSNLVMVSEDLGKLDIDNQIYRGKHAESRSNRFAHLMQAFNVTFINSFKTEFGIGSEDKIDIKESLISKKHFIALLAAGSDCTVELYNQALQKVSNQIENIRFIQEKSISLIYGEQSITKKVYCDKGEFHYVGQFGIANIELMHYEMSKYLHVSGSKATLIAILQMSDFEEIQDYLQEKGYDVSLLPKQAKSIDEIEISVSNGESGVVTISLSDTPYSGLSSTQMSDALIDAKKAVETIMVQQGFQFTQGLCEGDYGNIYGVKKDGVEYPLVVHSYKNQNRPFQLTAFDWDQLSQPNSMLWVNTYEGVKCVPFYALARDRGTINISFDTANFEVADRSKALAQVLRYFKGLHFDFGSMLTAFSNQVELFNKPEKPITEALNAKEDNLLL